MPILLWLFLMLFAGDVAAPAYADSGRDRCRTTDCLCSVSRGRTPTPRQHTVTNERRMLVYFGEDDDELTAAQTSSIISFARGARSNVNVTLMGYTDGCGTKEYNRALAARRVQQVKAAIQRERPGTKVTVVIGGEQVNHHSSEARRVDIIVHTDVSFTTRIEKVPADVYLIDGSGSMWESRREWTDLVNASLRPGAKIYMSMMYGCYNGQNLDDVNPQGGTEIWMSYYAVLDHMRVGETLLIISDFQSNYPLTSRESALIKQKAKAKAINVITIR